MSISVSYSTPDYNSQLEEKIKSISRNKISAFKSKNGLTPDEIFFLSYAPKYKIGENEFQKFWYYDWAISSPEQLLRKLEENGFIKSGGIEPALSNLKVSELKNILTKLETKTTGNKSELVQRILSTADTTFLNSLQLSEYYKLTDLGKKELQDNEYVIYFGKNIKYGFNVWEVNYKIGNGNPKRYRDIIWSELQRKNHEAINNLNNGNTGEYINCNMECYHFILEEEKNYNIALTSLAEAIYYEYNYNAVSNYLLSCELQKYNDYTPKLEFKVNINDFRFLRQVLGDEIFIQVLKRSLLKELPFTSDRGVDIPFQVIKGDELMNIIIEFTNGNEIPYNEFVRRAESELNVLAKTNKKSNYYESNTIYNYNEPQYNKYVAFFLCLFLGFLGVHKFYIGKQKEGKIYLFTLGLFGIGWIVDCIVLGIKALQRE